MSVMNLCLIDSPGRTYLLPQHFEQQHHYLIQLQLHNVLVHVLQHFNSLSLVIFDILLNFNLAPLHVELFMCGQRRSNFLLLLLNALLKNISANIWFVCQIVSTHMCFHHLNAARVFGEGYIY